MLSTCRKRLKNPQAVAIFHFQIILELLQKYQVDKGSSLGKPEKWEMKIIF